MRLTVPYEFPSAAEARAWVRAELTAREVPPQVVEDAVIVVSELVGNALRHAVPLPDGTVRIEATVGRRQVRLAVTDGGAGPAPEAQPAEPLDVAGRGLNIVDRLAVRWGHDRSEDALTVWAEVAAQPDDPD